MDLIRLGGDADFSLMPGLFPAHLRSHVIDFGRFVRLADGIADTPWLRPAEKTARLEALEAALTSPEDADWSEEARQVVSNFRGSLIATGISPEHARHILQAFKRDVSGHQSRTWSELMVYCQFAAAPIGRHMLDLLGEDTAVCGRPTDAMCAALRILKRLRDCKDPSTDLHRLCIPEQFMRDATITNFHLSASKAKGQTRAVIDRTLDGVDRLLREAAPLPKLIQSRGLSMHTAIVLCRARKLARRFRVADPLQGRVGLSGWQRRLCRWSTLLRAAVGFR